jgi:hypothetical protein
MHVKKMTVIKNLFECESVWSKLLKWYSDSNKFMIENAHVPLHLFDLKKNRSWYAPYGYPSPTSWPPNPYSRPKNKRFTEWAERLNK